MTNIISLLGARKVPHWLIKQYYETFRLFNLLWWSFHRVSRKKVYSVRWNCWIFFLFLFFSLFLYICLLRLLGKWLCLRTRNLGYYIHNKIIVFHFRKEEVFIFLSFAQKTPNILGYFFFFLSFGIVQFNLSSKFYNISWKNWKGKNYLLYPFFSSCN